MAKRFTDTNKYKKPFIRGLQGAYKLLWDYLYHDCDHAGIWIVDFEIAQLYIGSDMPINKIDALKYFNADENRIVEFDNKKKWFIPSFIEFQYGELKENNRAHLSVISILNKYNLNKIKLHISPLQGGKDKDKEMDMDKDELLKGTVREKINFSDLENIQWFETILRYLQLKITYDELMQYWKLFQEGMTADDDLYRDKEDYRSHFRNWVKIQIEKNEKTIRINRNGKDFDSDTTRGAIAAVERTLREHGTGNAFTHTDRD